MQELAEQPGGQVVAQLVPLLLRQLVPLSRSVDRAELLGLIHNVGRVDRDRPVDPLGRVPLLVLAALVQVEQAAPAAVVLPAEPGGSGRGHVPGPGRDGGRVVVIRAHAGLPYTAISRYYPLVPSVSMAGSAR